MLLSFGACLGMFFLSCKRTDKSAITNITPPVPVVAHLTFSSWHPRCDRDKVGYIWCGELVGIGAKGISEVKLKIFALTDKSTIHVYPTITMLESGNGSDFDTTAGGWHPGYSIQEEMFDVIRQKHLEISFNDYDSNGNPVEPVPWR